MFTDTPIYSENQLLKFFFTAKIAPSSYKSIHAFYCGKCKIENFINLDISGDENDKKWIESTIKNNKNGNLPFVAKIYPMKINFCQEVTFDPQIEQTIYKRPFEEYAKAINRNNLKENEDDIIFHCFDEQKQDKILKKYYFHCLLYWEKFDYLSKLHKNCFLVRKALVIGTKLPCFNFCYNILTKLYKIFKNGKMNNCIDIILKKLFEEVKVKQMFNNIIHINLDDIHFKSDKEKNNLINDDTNQNEQISYSIKEYTLPLDSQLSLFDLNLFYFFQIFSMEDILQIYSLFRFQQNIVFISSDIYLLYPIFYIVQHLFAPLCFSHDFFIYKNLSTIDPDSFKDNFSSKSKKMLFVMGMEEDNYYEYFKSLIQYNADIQKIALFYIKSKQDTGYMVDKKAIFKLSLLKGEEVFVEDLKMIPFYQTLFGTQHEFNLQMEKEIKKFISRSQKVKYNSFYGYDPKLNDEFYSFSKKMFVCNLRIIEYLFKDFKYIDSIHFLYPNFGNRLLKFKEHKEEIEQLFNAIYLSYQFIIPSYDFLLDVFIFYYSKMYEKKQKIANDISFSQLPNFTIKCNLNQIITNYIMINQEKDWNFEISNKGIQNAAKPFALERPELNLINQEICVFDYMCKIGLISFNLVEPTFDNETLGLGLYCLIKSMCLINGYNHYIIYNDSEFESEKDFIKNEINQLFYFLITTKGFKLFQLPIPFIILLKILYNEDTINLAQPNELGKYLNSFYLSLSSYIFLRENISKILKEQNPSFIIKNEHCGIVKFILFDDNGHNHYDKDNVDICHKSFSFSCCFCKAKLKLKIISINKETKKRVEEIITNIQSPNEIFPRVWEGICNKGLNINNCQDINHIFNYKEWEDDYKLIFFYAYFLWGKRSINFLSSIERRIS